MIDKEGLLKEGKARTMYAKTTVFQFHPSAAEEGTRIIRDIMIPGARKQHGFMGAIMLKHDNKPDHYLVVSIWETEAALLASSPPEELLPLLEPLEELIAEYDQDTGNVLLFIHN